MSGLTRGTRDTSQDSWTDVQEMVCLKYAIATRGYCPRTGSPGITKHEDRGKIFAYRG